jgi:predicted nucleic acid-binding protein
MTYYLDTSIVLNVLLQQELKVKQFADADAVVSSELLRVECFRTLDRLRIQNKVQENDYLELLGNAHFLLKAIGFLPITSEVLSRASQRMPTALGTLDAIHLATCQLYSEGADADVSLFTNDQQLSRAARAIGITTV